MPCCEPGDWGSWKAVALDRRLPRRARSARTAVVAAVALGVATALLLVAQAWQLARTIAAAFAGGSPELRSALGWLLAVVLARATVAWLSAK